MSNYDLDEEERRARQWDAQTQTYVTIKEHEKIDLQKMMKNPLGYEGSENTLQPGSNDKVDTKSQINKSTEELVTNPTYYDNVGFAIQPIEYITKNELDFLEGNVIKYVSRYPHKGGVNDLLKAKTYIEFLITRERERE